jgi:hypothetical protein
VWVFAAAVEVGHMEIDYSESLAARLRNALALFFIPMLWAALSVACLYFRNKYGKWITLTLDFAVGILMAYFMRGDISAFKSIASQSGLAALQEDTLEHAVVLLLAVMGIAVVNKLVGQGSAQGTLDSK